MKLKKLAELCFWSAYCYIALCLAVGIFVSLFILASSVVEQYDINDQVALLLSFIMLTIMLAYMVAQKLPKKQWLNLLFLFMMPILLAYNFYDLYTNPVDLFSLEALGFDLLALITIHLYWTTYNGDVILVNKASIIKD